MPEYMRFDDGAVQFRLRLAVSLLSGKPLLIKNIRPDEDEPGLRDYEANFLRLIDLLTNGSTIEINSTGTQLKFIPGGLLGGYKLEHVCPESRSLGWFLEGLLPIAMFGKNSLELTLKGSTDSLYSDPSPEYLQMTVVPLMVKFGVGGDDEAPPPKIQVLNRGTVSFTCPAIKELSPIDLTDAGKIKRIRGTARSCRIPPSSTARVAYACKGLLHRLLPDVWIHTDAQKGASPSLNILLTSESTTGVLLSAEYSMDPSNSSRKELPEDVGMRGASLLLEEIRRGGCVDTTSQSLALLLMCLGPEDVARIRVGTLSQYTVHALRLYRRAFGIEFKLKTDEASRTILCSCLGSGYVNMARAAT